MMVVSILQALFGKGAVGGGLEVAFEIEGLKPSGTFCGPAFHLAISLSSVSTVLLTLLIRRYKVLGLFKSLRDGPVDRASLEKGRTAH
jgi:hypothetical protein